MKNRRFVGLLICVITPFLLLIGSVPAIGQTTNTTGSIVGVVTDTSGAVMASAKLTLTSATTGATTTASANGSGQYSFPVVAPGTYTLSATAQGFQTSVVSGVIVQVAKSTAVNIVLNVGSVSQSVQVHATAQTELQTTDAAVSGVMAENEVENLPTVTRRAVELAWLQPGAQPWTGGAYNGSSGTIAGAAGDQNNWTLDGIDVSDSQVGGECCGNYGSGLPLPVEAVQEFNSSVTNQNANFGRSAGGNFAFSVRQGSPAYHGAAYWYHVDDHLVANTFFADALGQPKAHFLDNRAGFRLGGPLLGPVMKKKLFFFLNLERRRFPNSTQVEGLVPNKTLRQGILTFTDCSKGFTSSGCQGGVPVQYNLATSTLCGPAGNLPCDPRGIGLSPVIAQQYALLPAGNVTGVGSNGFNTDAIIGPASSAQNSDNAVGRLDYTISPSWHVNGIWAWGDSVFFNPFNDPGIDWRGGPSHIVTTASIPNHAFVYGVGLTGQISPTVVNEFHAGFHQSDLQFAEPPPTSLIPAAGVALDLPVIQDPIQIFGSRAQLGISKTWQFSDNVTKILGKHQFQFGVNYEYLYYSENRQGENQFNVFPMAEIGVDQNVPVPNSERPPSCGIGVTTSCLQASDVGLWNQLYGATLGIIDSVNEVVARTPQGTALPVGTNVIEAGNWHHFEYHISDIWRINNSFTLNLGLLGSIETPFSDSEGRQSFIVNQQTGQPIDPVQYLAQRAAAARVGEVYNPGFAWAPIGDFGGRGLFPIQNHLGPRLGAAWNPAFAHGLLGRLLGNRKSVFRGGFGIGYYRALTIGEVNFAEEGDQLLAQSASLIAPVNGSGQPYRVGVDGPVPLPPVAPQVASPYIPPSDHGIATLLAFSPNYRLASMNSVDATYQREIPGNMIVEAGYMGRFGRHLETDLDINAAPFFIADLSHQSSQNFAQAYDQVATQLRQGISPANVTPQPWFENSIGPGATVGLASTDSSDFLTAQVETLWEFHIDPMLMAAGKQPVENPQLYATLDMASNGWSNYNALFFNVNKRTSQGLTFTFNDTISTWKTTLEDTTDSGGTEPINSYDLNYNYGPAFGDRKNVISAYGVYDLPFGEGHRFRGGPLRRVVDDWHWSNVITFASGLPVFVNMGAEPFGSLSGNESIPTIAPLRGGGASVHSGIAGSNGVGINGFGLNMFSNPAAVYSDFRPFLISQDTHNSQGVIRGLSQFTWDMSLSKGIEVTERLKLKLGFDFFNVLNHPLFNTPFLNFLDPADFGTITSQPGDPANGDYWTPRRLQVSLRVEF